MFSTAYRMFGRKGIWSVSIAVSTDHRRTDVTRSGRGVRTLSALPPRVPALAHKPTPTLITLYLAPRVPAMQVLLSATLKIASWSATLARSA